MPPPLLRLFKENVAEARVLGLIESPDADVQAVLEEVAGQWQPDTDALKQEWHYDEQMSQLVAKLDRSFRPQKAHGERDVELHRVMNLASFVKRWLDVLIPDPSLDPELQDLVDCITDEQNSPCDDAAARGRVRDCCLKLEGRCGGRGSSPGVEMSLQALTASGKPMWTGTGWERDPTDAQFWRDRLGLIHVKMPNRPLLRDALVRVRLQATASETDLPREDYKIHRNANPEGLWLIRPSVVHEGNRRFVQGIAADRGGGAGALGRPGRTRDLASAHYVEGECETMLVFGDRARARFGGIQLLDGLADTVPGRDDQDDRFVECIARERGWK